MMIFFKTYFIGPLQYFFSFFVIVQIEITLSVLKLDFIISMRSEQNNSSECNRNCSAEIYQSNYSLTDLISFKLMENSVIKTNNSFRRGIFISKQNQKSEKEISIRNLYEKRYFKANQKGKVDIADRKIKESEILRKFSSNECIDLRNLNTKDKLKNSTLSLKSIDILGLFDLTRKSVTRHSSESEVAAVKLAVKHINQMKILGCQYQLNLIVNDSQADPGVAVSIFYNAMYHDREMKTIKAILTPSNTEVTSSLAKISAAWNLPTVSSGETLPEMSDNEKYPMFFRLAAPDSSHNQARIAFLHFFKWDSVITICQQDDKYFWSINNLLAELETSNITQEKPISFSEQDLVTNLKLVKERDSKIIVASFSEKLAPILFCKIHDLDLYGGDYVWILPAFSQNNWWNSNVPCPTRKFIESINGTIFVDSKRKLDDREESISFMNDEEFENSLPSQKNNFVRESYDSVWSIALALRNALASCNEKEIDCHNVSLHNTFQELFTTSFQTIKFQGISGPVLFQGANRLCITNFYQVQSGRMHQIAEYNPLTNELNFNCSKCKKIWWPSGYIPVSKRQYQHQTVFIIPLAFIIVNLFSLIGIVISLCFLVMNIYYREQKYIKLSSPYLNVTTIMGCILVYLSVIFMGVDSGIKPEWLTFPIICMSRVTLISTGCSLAFGSIFAKTYRVHQIFIKSNHGILKSKVLQDSRLVPTIGFFVLIDGVIISVWVIIDPLDRQLYNLTLDGVVHHSGVIHQLQVEVCESNYKNTWLFSLSIYKAIFIILGLYMAWETRNVKIPSLNDSEHIGLTVYTVSITVVLHFTLSNVISDRITLAYLTSSSLILFTTTSSMCLLFLPKITAIFEKKNSLEKVIGNSDLKIESNTIRFIKNDDQEPYYRVHIQNFAYRKYIAFLDREIQNLHYRIYIKKNNRTNFTTVKTTSSKICDKIPTLSRFRREKSSSFCEGIPNLFMLTVLPVVIPRASWPYTEHLEKPVMDDISCSSESRLQFMKYRRSSSSSLSNVLHPIHHAQKRRHSFFATNQPNQEELPNPTYEGEGSSESLSSPKKPYIDDYEDTSSEASENEEHIKNTILKICKAIIHKPIENSDIVTPTITVTYMEAEIDGNRIFQTTMKH